MTTEIVDSVKYGRTDAERLEAIAWMSAEIREYKGEMIPPFAQIGRELGVEETTLRYWWDKREEIVARTRGFLPLVGVLQATKLNSVINRAIKALETKLDEGALKPQELINAIDRLVPKARLLSGMSTQSVAHKHEVVCKLPGKDC